MNNLKTYMLKFPETQDDIFSNALKPKDIQFTKFKKNRQKQQILTRSRKLLIKYQNS